MIKSTTDNNQQQFLKEDFEDGISKHHKNYLGTEVPEGYFVKSKTSILHRIKSQSNKEIIEKSNNQSVFLMQSRFKYMAAASLVFILSLTVWLQNSNKTEVVNEPYSESLIFSDTVLIESLLVEENEVDAFADITLFREILVKSELFEQKIENLVFENLILEDSLIHNYLDDGLIETIIL